jgi:hypothetical protein
MDTKKIERPPCTGGGTPCKSELEQLSSDPTLAKHPNPALHPKFRDPDELCEDESSQTGVDSVAPSRAKAQRWSGSTAWRRSPKE